MFTYIENYSNGTLDSFSRQYPKLAEVNCFLAGGALLQIHNPRHIYSPEIRDWDIFAETKNDIKLLDTCFKKAYLFPHVQLNSINFGNISLITRFYGKPEEILSTFDFTVVCCAYVFKTKTLIYHQDFFRDLNNKELHLVNYDVKNLHLSKYRVQKYRKKGFRPQPILLNKEMCNYCYKRIACLVEGKNLCQYLSD